KLKKLKQDFKKTKAHNNRSGSGRKTGKWYDLLDSILGHRPAYTASVTIKDSSQHQQTTNATPTPMHAQRPNFLSFCEAGESRSPQARCSTPQTRKGKRKREDTVVEVMHDLRVKSKCYRLLRTLKAS
ncbi:hypothetical protein CRUP_014280, partial [Coryphaenoides rupestris]